MRDTVLHHVSKVRVRLGMRLDWILGEVPASLVACSIFRFLASGDCNAACPDLRLHPLSLLPAQQ